MSVGSRLKEERQRLGYQTQEEFAEIAGVVRVTQSNYELDKRSPDNDYWQAVSRVGVNVGYVLTGSKAVRVEGKIYDINDPHLKTKLSDTLEMLAELSTQACDLFQTIKQIEKR